jgi:hydrogenase maturation protein HypF
VGSDPAIIRTLPLFERLDSIARGRELTESEKANLSRSFIQELVRRMVETSVVKANENNIKNIGLTGGVSYSLPIVRMVSQLVKESGMELILHNSVPNGDGGISVGQNAIAGSLI